MDAGAIAEATAFRCLTFRHTMMGKSTTISEHRNVGHKKHAQPTGLFVMRGARNTPYQACYMIS